MRDSAVRVEAGTVSTMGSEGAAELGRLIADARDIVVFTGAGVSTESGISDFRSPGGLWSRMSPIYYQDFVSSHEARVESWRRKIETDARCWGPAPTAATRSSPASSVPVERVA